MRPHALGGWLLVAWLALQTTSGGAATLLFLTGDESLFTAMQEGAWPPAATRSAPLAIDAPAGGLLRGFFAGSPARPGPTATDGMALAELCRRERIDALVAFGPGAAQAAARACGGPLLVAWATRQQVTPLLAAEGRGSRSAIYLEAEPRFNLRLARALLPAARTVGVLVPTPAPAWLEPLRIEARRLEFVLEEIPVTDAPGTARALRPRLDALDAVLLPPETTVIDEWSLKTLLLMTIRQGVPAFGGLTARYVDAGVLAAVVADEERLSAQIQTVVADLVQGRAPPPAYPTAVRVALNPTVARTLGVSGAAVDRARALFARP